MLVVTGAARSGTSLMMQALKNMGFIIGGDKFPGDITEDGREDRNPEGFWEIQYLPYQGLQSYMFDPSIPAPNPETEVRIDPNVEVVKLTLEGLLNSDYRYLNKVILCIRNPREVIVSQRKQVNFVNDAFAWKNFIRGHRTLLNVLKPQAWLDTFCIMDYNRLMKDPDTELSYLCNFVGKYLTEDVRNVVKPELYRSRANEIKKNKKAAELYKVLLQTMNNQRTYWR